MEFRSSKQDTTHGSINVFRHCKTHGHQYRKRSHLAGIVKKAKGFTLCIVPWKEGILNDPCSRGAYNSLSPELCTCATHWTWPVNAFLEQDKEREWRTCTGTSVILRRSLPLNLASNWHLPSMCLWLQSQNKPIPTRKSFHTNWPAVFGNLPVINLQGRPNCNGTTALNNYNFGC